MAHYNKHVNYHVHSVCVCVVLHWLFLVGTCYSRAVIIRIFTEYLYTRQRSVHIRHTRCLLTCYGLTMIYAVSDVATLR